jgi:hypothetical protein
MSDDVKKRVEKAMMKFAEKQLPKKRRSKNENKEGPVVLEIKNALFAIGFSLDVVEAKATWNERAGRYMSSQAVPGFPDLCGTGPDGESVWIEVKARGKRHTIRPTQFNFLLEKIKQGAFGVCADSSAYVIECFRKWKSLERMSRQNFLIAELPKALKFLEAENDELF